MVRYFGCGKNRVRTEPPVRKGVLENCQLTEDPEVHDFMYSMCGNGDISTGKCRLQHGGIQVFSYPCWSVLTGKTGPANQVWTVLGCLQPPCRRSLRIPLFEGSVASACQAC